MKKILLSISALTVLISLLLTGCTSAIGDRENYANSDKTGMALNLAEVAINAPKGIYAIPFPTHETGFAGTVNNVNRAGDTYTDQTGAKFPVRNGMVTAPKDVDGNYIDDSMMIWFMLVNPNFEKDPLVQYDFPLQVSGTFSLTGLAAQAPVIGENNRNYRQFAGFTLGFIDNMTDQNQNGGIMLKAIKTSDTESFLVLQVVDASNEPNLMDIPYPITAENAIALNTPFEISLRISGGSNTPTGGPTLHVYFNGTEVFPQGKSAAFNGSTYGEYITNTGLWGMIPDKDQVWRKLWTGGMISVKTVAGCIGKETGMAVFIADLGINADLSDSVNLIRLESTTVEDDMYPIAP